MGSTNLERRIADRQRDARRALGAELRRARLDANLSIRSVSAAAGLHHSHLPRIEIGKRSPSQDALVALATVMGRDVSIRLFESTTPQVRDRIQVRMIEALLAALHPRWAPRLEVAVHMPVRGVIDVVLQDMTTAALVAGEAHSVLHTVEGQLRWAGDKAGALSSAHGWPWVDTGEPPTVGRLLLLRSCAAMHELVMSLPATFAAAYPGDTEEAVAALTGSTTPWPGAAIVWVAIDGKNTRLLRGVPRLVAARRGVGRAASR
jgi:transcriptional regulator with XRE-family HTH domain